MWASSAYLALHLSACQIYDATMLPGTAEGLTRRRVDLSDGRSVSYLSTEGADDSEPRIIYVHGTPGSATAFDDYLEEPIEGYRGIAPDRFGFGRTKPAVPEPSLHEQVKALEPFLVERHGHWPILVGHSLGGPIVAEAAVEYPDRVGGIVILSGSLDPDFEKVYWFQRVGNFAFIPYMMPRFLRNSNRELLPLKGELEKLKPHLKDIRSLVTIVHATNDRLVPYANVDYMKHMFRPEVIHEIVTLDDKDHFIPWNAEPTVRAAIQSLAEAVNGTDRLTAAGN
jgi:pimeloyl-ACP methyl ester carboxylesterase